jgi:hypothetical protein
MIEVAIAIEDHGGDAGGLRFFGDRHAHVLRLLDARGGVRPSCPSGSMRSTRVRPSSSFTIWA